ncbi:MAG: acetyltransferase [Acidobacteria bacterium]|nr:acetyltransferase [Acidobacteriota bacterium]
MKKKAILFGNAKFAEMNHFYLTHDSAYEVSAFTVDGAHIRYTTMLGLPVVAFEEISKAFPPKDYAMAMPLGLKRVNRTRAEKYAHAKSLGYEFVTYVNSKAIVAAGSVIGENCFLYENVIVKPFSRIGNNVMIETGSLVGHHVAVGDHCFLGPQSLLLGECTVQEYSIVGANATIREAVTVGSDCIIGVGVVVTRSTRPGSVYLAGAPELLSGTSSELSGLLEARGGA